MLEAPSTLGLAAPGAAALDDSEPTFPSSGDDSAVESAYRTTEGSLEGYSPSPDRNPITRRGFNLLVPNGLHLEGMAPEHESERIALHALRESWLWEEDLLCLAEHGPSCTRMFQRSTSEHVGSCSFLTGAYIHGCSAGVTKNTRNFPLVTSLITSVIRSVAPSSWFSISLNLQSGVHKDSNNSSSIPHFSACLGL